MRTEHVVFLRRGTLMAVAFDPGRREVNGQPVPVIANVLQALNLANTGWNCAAGQYSVSDSGWLAYALNESGSSSSEVWVRPFPGPGGGRWQISKEGGGAPIWSRDGRQLFYGHKGAFLAVDVRAEGGLAAGSPRPLFNLEGFGWITPTRGWDQWPDGKGFLMVKLEETKPQTVKTEMILVQNWFDELKRLAPTKIDAADRDPLFMKV